ncbi:GPI transamidase component PIG-T [Tanacetum coccineum]
MFKILVHKYRIRELELSFTQGRWNYQRLGGFDRVASSNAKPPGVELWAVFDVLTYQSSTTYAAPDWSFRPVSGNLRPSIYRGFYHFQWLHLTSNEFDPVASGNGIVLEQTLTIFLQPDAIDSHSAFSNSRKLQPSWSMNSLFGRTVNGKCALAKSSNVYVQGVWNRFKTTSRLENLLDVWVDVISGVSIRPANNDNGVCLFFKWTVWVMGQMP